MTVPSGEATVASAQLLRIVSSDLSDRSGEEITVSDVMTIGREPGCDIVLAERAVSRRHARVEPTPDGLKLTDLGSGNGVWMGARKVEEQVLSAGDHFQIGSTVFECVRVQQPAVAPAVADEAQEATMFMPSPVAVTVKTAAAGKAGAPFIVRL